MKHGMRKRNKAKGLRSTGKRVASEGRMVIAFSPGPEYGFGPSGGLMRGYGKPENVALAWLKRALGRKA